MRDAPRLRALERAIERYGPGEAVRKIELLEEMRRARLGTAAGVRRLHEALLVLRAYPDDAAVVRRCERLLASFERRPDLARHRGALADSGIAGTPIRYRFFWPTAAWLARRWPGRLRIDWEAVDDPGTIDDLVRVAATWAERAWIGSASLGAREALDRLRETGEADGACLVRRLEALAGDDVSREALHDRVDVPYVLDPGPGGPSRTRSRDARAALAFRSTAPSRRRPDLRSELARPPRVIRDVPPAEGRRLIDLAREAMVTRSRDLDCFAWGDPRDVRVVEDGDGLTFAWIGMIPERRLLLQAAYGALTLRSGVPIGYVQADALLRSVEISYNTFETFRGREAAFVFSRVLAACRALFGARSFSIEPYQLGHGNAEGIASGAWWFYYKLGFRPRDRAVRRLAALELRRMAADPSHRSGPRTLERLAARHVFWEPEGERAPVLSRLARIGAHAAGAPSGADAEAARLAGIGSMRGWSRGERLWWSRWSPIVLALPGIARWPLPDRRALARAIRAKGGRRESDFVRLLDRHPRAGAALDALASRPAGRGPRAR